MIKNVRAWHSGNALLIGILGIAVLATTSTTALYFDLVPDAVQRKVLPEFVFNKFEEMQSESESGNDSAPAATKTTAKSDGTTKEYRVTQAFPGASEGYSLRYPGNWFLDAGAQVIGGAILSSVDPAVTSDKNYGAPCFMIHVQPKPKMEAKAFYEKVIPIYRKSDPGAKYGSSSLTIAGRTTYRMDVSMTRVQQCVHSAMEQKFSTPGTYAEMIVETEKHRYTLSYTYGSEETAAQGMLEGIVKSFAILP